MTGNHDSLPDTRAEWHQRVLSLAVPIIFSNLSVPLVGLVDTAVMGHLPDPAYIGAVAIGAVLFSFVFWGFGFLRMGTTGLIAQAYGRRDGSEIRTIIAQGAGLAMVLAVLVLLLQVPILVLGLSVVEGDDSLKTLAAEYFHWRVWATPAVLLNYLMLGTLIGLRNTRAVLITQLVLNLTNVALDLLFVPVLGMGVEGVAIASLIAEFAALGVGIWLVRSRLREVSGDWNLSAMRDSRSVIAMLKVNTNIMIRTLLLLGVFGYFTVLGTRMGPEVLAANAVLVQLLHFMAFGLDGFAFAAEALVGAAYGAKNQKAFDEAVRVSTIWAAGVALLIVLIYALAGPMIVSLITDIESVRLTAADYLPWLALAPLFSVWSYQLDGIFIGTTRSAEMRNAMAVSVLFFLAASHLLIPVWANHGLWLSLLGFNLVRAISLYALMGRIKAALRVPN
ncbi:MAG: MATE family efflux transporter [Gammaproteobacteria bacterium]